MVATREEFTRTNAAKSDQMNAVDLIAGPMVFVITDIRMTGAADQPVSISVDAHAQPWKPSKTFRRVLTAAWHDEPSEWIGRYVVLWCDPDITWACDGMLTLQAFATGHPASLQPHMSSRLKSSRL